MNNRKTQEAENYHTSYSYPDPETYQQEFNYGQARINFELNKVDMDFVEALKAIVKFLEKVKGLPSLAHDLSAIDFTTINKALADAEARSKTVADIRPPGCEGPYPN